MESEETLFEIIRMKEELCKLKTENFRMQQQKATMQNTIETLLSLKCKRGEGSFVLTDELLICIKTNFDECVRRVMTFTTMKSSDMFVWFLLHLLTGIHKNKVPCALLDNCNNVVYKEDNQYIAVNVNTFSNIVQKTIQKLFIENSICVSDSFADCMLLLADNEQFTQCMKKTMRVYKDT